MIQREKRRGRKSTMIGSMSILHHVPFLSSVNTNVHVKMGAWVMDSEVYVHVHVHTCMYKKLMNCKCTCNYENYCLEICVMLCCLVVLMSLWSLVSCTQCTGM